MKVLAPERGVPVGGWATLLCAWLFGCGPPTPAPTVLLVSLDTTRADRLGAYGHGGGITPNLDRFARQGLVFERAWATNPITLPSHTTMLTGVYSAAHGVQDNGAFQVRDEARLLPEVLTERGYRCAAFVATFVLHNRYGLDQGFEHYDAPSTRRAGHDDRSYRPANEVVDRVDEWLEGVSADQPLFLWVHFYDPHEPRQPPEPWASRFADPYDGEVAFCDDQFGRLQEVLEHHERGDRLTIVTADHGESLGEHGEMTHGIFLYEGAMRIPMLVASERHPEWAGRRVAAPVTLTDIAPTVLGFARVASTELPRCKAPSLTSWLDRDPTAKDRALLLQSFLPYYSLRWHPLQGVVWKDYKLITGRSSELYHLTEDPRELQDLAAEEEEVHEQLERRLVQLLKRNQSLGWQQGVRIDSAASDKLAALGYLAASSEGPVVLEGLPDPRDHLGDLALQDEARDAIQRGAALLAQQTPDARAEAAACLQQARRALEELGRSNPLDPYHDEGMAQLELALGRFSDALPYCERTVLARPNSAAARRHLAICYLRTGRPDWAILEMHKALTHDPDFLMGYHFLAGYYLSVGEFGRASWWLSQVRERLSADPESWAPFEPMWQQAEEGRVSRGQQPVAPADYPLDEWIPEGRR